MDDIIVADSSSYKNFVTQEHFSNKNLLISVIDHLCETAKSLNFNKILYFSPNLGVIDYLNKSNNNSIKNQNNSDEFDEFGGNETRSLPSLEAFIDEINMQIQNLREDPDGNVQKKLFILECSDIFLEKNSNISNIHLSTLISSFIDFEKQKTTSFYKHKIKLVIISRNTNVINNLVTYNNIEYCSINLLKPDKNEREEFFDLFKNRFHTISDSCKQKGTKDYNEVISLTDGMSFREILQYAKIDPLLFDNNELSFKELYKLVSFNKKESEWEKIEFSKIQNIEQILSKRVKGQDNAINSIKKTLIRSFTGMNGVLHSASDNKKPKGVLFFVGPTGVGKTELAKSISEFIFGDENRIIRFDMSEFNHEHSDQRLIGAPPGYVGYDAGGELTNAVKENPFSILLFDEIEKAHGKILDKFLQILEDGRLTSSQGEIIDFSETFIIFTSNIGTKDCKVSNDYKEIYNHFHKSVYNHFTNVLGRPEILNRIGTKNVIPFMFLSDEKIVNKIIISKLDRLEEWIKKDKYIKLEFKNDAKEQICSIVFNKFDNKMGGRGVVTQLETSFIDELSIFIFTNYNIIKEHLEKEEYTKIEVSVKNNEINFEIF